MDNRPAAHADQVRAPPGPEQSPVLGGARIPPPRRPSYVPWKQRRVEEEEKQRHAAAPPHAAAPEEQQQAEKTPVVVLAGPRPPRTITTPKTTVRTGGAPADGDGAARPPSGPISLTPSPHYQNKMKREPVVFCRIVFCIHILLLLLIIAVGLATIAISLAYHPKSPRLSVTSTTLKAAHIDKLDGGGGARLALSANLTVLAAISNPNTKISIVLRYVRFDLYFEDTVIGTQAVWPAPVQVGPGGSVLRRVHLVTSNVTVTQQDAIAWQNATANGGKAMALRLAGRFHTQLNFDRWFFRYRYWVKPQCRLWLDPPPSGALRRSQC